MKCCLKSAALLITLAQASWAGQATRLDPPHITVSDLKGTQHRIPAPDHKATVLFFVAHDCPISNAYVPEMNRIIADYKSRGLPFFAVYVDLNVPLSEIKSHARNFGIQNPILVDDKHVLVNWTGATVTPQAAVVGSDGQILYLGRIDDLYYDFGRRRGTPTKREVRDALEAILKGESIAPSTEKPLGCTITPYREGD